MYTQHVMSTDHMTVIYKICNAVQTLNKSFCLWYNDKLNISYFGILWYIYA